MLLDTFFKCSLCGKKQTQPMTHICEAEGCEAPICGRCWNVFHKHRCPIHTQSYEASLCSSPFENQEFLQNLKNQESVFIERIRAQFSDMDVIYHPLTEQPFPLAQNWKILREGSDEKQVLARFSATQRGNIPLNRSITYALKLPRGSGILPDELVLVEAKYWFNWEAFFVLSASSAREWNEPISKSALLSFIADYSELRQKDNGFVLLGIFSPSGWSAEAIQSIEGEDRFVSPNLAVILLSENGMCFDKRSLPTVFLAPIFGKELLRDRLNNCEKAIENELIGVRHVSLYGLSLALPYPKPFIRQIMQEMAKKFDDLVFDDSDDSVGDILRRRI